MLATYTVQSANAVVLGRLGDSSYSTTLLQQFASDVNREICNAAEWPFMETTFTGTAASGNVFFNLQSSVPDFQVPVSFQLNAPDASAVSVRYWPHERFFKAYPDPTALSRARPTIWSTFGSTLVIGPQPLDQTYTFQVLYLREPTELTATTGAAGTFDVPNAFSELVVLGMLARAMMAKDWYDKAQVIQQEFDLKINEMIRRLTLRQTGDTVENNWRGQRDPWDEIYS